LAMKKRVMRMAGSKRYPPHSSLIATVA